MATMAALRVLPVGSAMLVLLHGVANAQTCLPRWSAVGDSSTVPPLTTLAASPSGPIAGLYGSGSNGRVYGWSGGAWNSTLPPTPSSSVAVFAATGGDQLWSCSQGNYSLGVAHLHIWNGTTWNAAPITSSAIESFARITAFRSPAVLYLAENFQGAAVLLGWNGTQWSTVRSYSYMKDPLTCQFGYRFNGNPYLGGWLTYDFSTHLCNQTVLRSNVTAIAAGTVAGVQRVFMGGPCLNENLGHIAMAPFGSASWTLVGDGLPDVNCLEVFDDGNGAALYAGTSTGIQRWSGGLWTAVGGGVNGSVLSLAVFDDGSGPALFVSGGFTVAGGVSTVHVARWGRPMCLANCDGALEPGGCPIFNAADFACFLNRFQNGDPRANCDGSTSTPVLTSNDFMCFLNSYASGCS